MTFIAHNGHLGMMRGVMKGVFLLGVLTTSGMTLEARTSPEGVAQMSGFLERAHKIRHGVTCCQYLDDHFIFDGRTNMAINALDVLRTFEIVGCGQSDPLTLHRMELGKFFFVEMASRAERVVLFQMVCDYDTPPQTLPLRVGEAPPGGGVASVVVSASHASCGVSGGLLHTYLHCV